MLDDENNQVLNFEVETAPTAAPTPAGPPPRPYHDPDVIRRFISAILVPGHCLEIRVLKAEEKNGFLVKGGKYAKTFSCFTNDCYTAAVEAQRANGVSAFVTINPVIPDLLARDEAGQLGPSSVATSDRNIARIRWAFVDIDSKRPSGISATDQELALAMAQIGRAHV